MVWGPQLPQEGWKPCQKCRRIRPRVLPCLPSEEAAVLPLPWLLGLPSEAPTTLCSTEGRQACLGKHPFTQAQPVPSAWHSRGRPVIGQAALAAGPGH